MLADKEAMATIAVKDLAAARKFYERTLGLQPIHEEGGGAVTYRSGSSSILVYQSQYAGTNQATAGAWTVGAEIDAIVETLRAAGVSFEHYDLPQTSRSGDIHIAGRLRLAWFKDLDGNILSLVGE